MNIDEYCTNFYEKNKENTLLNLLYNVAAREEKKDRFTNQELKQIISKLVSLGADINSVDLLFINYMISEYNDLEIVKHMCKLGYTAGFASGKLIVNIDNLVECGRKVDSQIKVYLMSIGAKKPRESVYHFLNTDADFKLYAKELFDEYGSSSFNLMYHEFYNRQLVFKDRNIYELQEKEYKKLNECHLFYTSPEDQVMPKIEWLEKYLGVTEEKLTLLIKTLYSLGCNSTENYSLYMAAFMGYKTLFSDLIKNGYYHSSQHLDNEMLLATTSSGLEMLKCMLSFGIKYTNIGWGDSFLNRVIRAHNFSQRTNWNPNQKLDMVKYLVDVLKVDIDINSMAFSHYVPGVYDFLKKRGGDYHHADKKRKANEEYCNKWSEKHAANTPAGKKN